MNILSNFPLSRVCTFKCGGCCKWFVELESLQEFANILKLHKGKPYFILGNGSKVLCVDSGYDGLVISTRKINNISFDGDFVVCECGVDMGQLQNFMLENELSGLEWASGIPATVGGATVMNVGSFTYNFGDFVEKVEIFDDFSRKILNKEQILFSYRNSSLKNLPVFKVWLKLKKGAKSEIKKLQDEFLSKKYNSQPMNFGSVGSIFKRKNDIIPSKIIDKLGLKGVKIGGAEISSLHSGFIVNNGNATATDIIALINLIKDTVRIKLGVELEHEIIILE